MTDLPTVDLRLGDCLDVLRSMPDGSVDIVVTSPPYNQLGSRIPAKPSGMHAANAWHRKVGQIGYADDMPEPDYQAWLRDVVAECLRVAKGLVWINHKVRYRNGEAIHPARFLPFPIYSEVVWDRRGSVAMNCRRPAPSHECLWAFGKPHWWDNAANRLMSVWKIAQVQNRTDHPCPFPLELARRPIVASCPPGGTVLDPFAGSGTTGEAATATGRNFIGIDTRADFLDIARRRIDAARAEAVA